jgi:hypothetical protein
MFRQRIHFPTSPSGIRIKGSAAPVETVMIKPSAPPAPVVFPTETVTKPTPPKPAAEPDLRPLLTALSHSIQEVEQRRQQSLGELQHLAVELSVAIASQLVFQAVDRGEFGVEELVRQAIHRFNLSDPITIALHPDDLALLQSRIASLEPRWPDGQVILQGDHAVARGGCRAESADGKMLISDITARLSEIRRHWMEELDDAQIERRRTSGEGPALRRFPDRRETA